MKRIGLRALLAIVLVGCGIPLDSGPEVFDVEVVSPPDDDAPDDDAPELGELSAVSMYLVRDEALVHVTRDLPSPLGAESILASLLGGVTEPEVRVDLRTSIPPETRVIEVTASGPVLRVNLSQDFAVVGGEEEILAVAQIVLTATSIEDVESVVFELEGVPTAVPLSNGALSVNPVNAADYASLVTP